MRNQCPVLQTLMRQSSGSNGLSFSPAVSKHISHVSLRIRIQDSEDSTESVRGLKVLLYGLHKSTFFLCI